MLFETERHESLTSAAWDEALARSAIERIGLESVHRFIAEGGWPSHPLDREVADAAAQYNLYFGTAGVIWALDHLRRRGAIDALPDFARALAGSVDANERMIKEFGGDTYGLLTGSSGIRLTQWKVAPSRALATRLAEDVAANQNNPVLEYMWGAPGTMLAAVAMYEWTGEAQWQALVRKSAEALWSSLEADQEYDCQIWTQHLYGSRSKLLGAVHGFAGNALALIRARHLLKLADWAAWEKLIARTLIATATRDDGLANWPQSIGTPRPGRTSWLLQHCHGAPGILNCLEDFPGTALNELLVAGAELVWQAGPLRKGSNLCHGTAGNGYALLKHYRRTGETKWLDRARAFAMHAIGQCEAEFERRGQYRYSLWTGDLGLAVFLCSCIEVDGDFPTLDIF